VFLQSRGISSSFYHAGLSHEEKSKREEAWRTDKIQVMVSTNAFGMGIDKPDVRTVVHLDLPDSLEAYFQEAGRGGRDEKKAYAVLLYDPADKHKTEKQLNAGFPGIEDCRKLYQNLADQYKIAIGSGEGESFDFDLAEFCKRFNWETLKAFQALKLLEQSGSISLSDAIYQPPRIQVTATREQLYKVQVEHSAYESLIQCLLRSYPGIFDDSVRVSLKDIARLSHLEPQATVHRLKTLHDRELIEFTQSSESPYLTLLQPRQDSSRLGLDPQFIADRKKEHEDRLHAMLSYVGNSETCRSVQLCRFFGEEDASRCGICDVCIAFKKTGLTDRGFEEIRSRIKATLKDERHSIRYFVDVLNMPETETLSVVQWMIEHNEVLEENGKLKLL
jgi:ATP-dependent DNA helicase RecQ